MNPHNPYREHFLVYLHASDEHPATLCDPATSFLCFVGNTYDDIFDTYRDCYFSTVYDNQDVLPATL